MRKFWFDGQCSTQFGIVASGPGTYNAPARDVETISIPGRSGDLIQDNGRFKNIPVTYPVFIGSRFPEKAEAARAWLLSKTGYRRLEDGYNPDTYRVAMFKGPIDFDVTFLNRAGEAKLTFECKPQRFLKAGEYPVTVQSGGVLWNPTLFPADPLITVYGTGAGRLTVGRVSVEIKAINEHLCLDSDTQNAYRVAVAGTPENRNSDIYAPEFPVLEPGENAISWTGDIEHIEIIPRWWTL